MRKYGDYSGLSETTSSHLQNLILQLEAQNCNCTIFYGFPLIELDNTTTIMKGCIISQKGIIILHDSDDERKVYWRHINKTIMECPSISELIMEPDLNLIKYRKCDDLQNIMQSLEFDNDIMSEQDVDFLVAVIQKAYNLTKFDNRITENSNTIGAIIKKRNNQVSVLDEQQFETIYKTQFGHTRIRGLAGSGKTILLAKKMAYLHYRNPELKMAYVFYTVSLKQFIEKLFINFYKEFDHYHEPDLSKILIVHSWGNKNIDGFYSTICKEVGVEKKNLRDVYGKNNKLDAVCEDLLQQIGSKDISLFDYIFIDEAQDFSIGFYKLATKSLKATGKLIYAYDELQSLNEGTSIPTKYQIFGRKPCQDINLPICYRTPNEILVTAHALGLGVYNQNKDGNISIVNMIQDMDTWSAIGYEVIDGELDFGKSVTLGRKDAITEKCSNSVEIIEKNDKQEQYQYVCEEAIKLIREEDVTPDDILIIDLDSININDDYASFKNTLYDHSWNNEKQDWICKTNLVNKDNAIKFRVSGSIPFTTIFRAKGNEANIVFVINAHKMHAISSYSRNRLFTAMTRARFKVYVLGSNGMEQLIKEAETVKNNNYTLRFNYPTKSELKKMSTIAKNEIKNAKDYEAIIDLFKNIQSNPALVKELLLEQLGISSLEELLSEMRESEEFDGQE